MTVNELIEALEKIKDDGKGDYEIAVQYRDGGGDYFGVDDDISCYVNETKKRIIL